MRAAAGGDRVVRSGAPGRARGGIAALGVLVGCGLGGTGGTPDAGANLYWTGQLLIGHPDEAATALAPVEERARAAFTPLGAAHDAAAEAIAAALRTGEVPPPAAVDALVAADSALRALALDATLDGLAAVGPPSDPALAPAVLARAVTLGPLRAVVEGHGQAPLPDLSLLPGALPPGAPEIVAADLARLAALEPVTLGFAHTLAALDPAAPDFAARLRAAVDAVTIPAGADLRQRVDECGRLTAELAPDARAALLDGLPMQQFCDLAPARSAFPFAYGDPPAPVGPAGPPATGSAGPGSAAHAPG